MRQKTPQARVWVWKKGTKPAASGARRDHRRKQWIQRALVCLKHLPLHNPPSKAHASLSLPRSSYGPTPPPPRPSILAVSGNAVCPGHEQDGKV